jgi:hypothetical protein
MRLIRGVAGAGKRGGLLSSFRNKTVTVEGLRDRYEPADIAWELKVIPQQS